MCLGSGFTSFLRITAVYFSTCFGGAGCLLLLHGAELSNEFHNGVDGGLLLANVLHVPGMLVSCQLEVLLVGGVGVFEPTVVGSLDDGLLLLHLLIRLLQQGVRRIEFALSRLLLLDLSPVFCSRGSLLVLSGLSQAAEGALGVLEVLLAVAKHGRKVEKKKA